MKNKNQIKTMQEAIACVEKARATGSSIAEFFPDYTNLPYFGPIGEMYCNGFYAVPVKEGVLCFPYLFVSDSDDGYEQIEIENITLMSTDETSKILCDWLHNVAETAASFHAIILKAKEESTK